MRSGIGSDRSNVEDRGLLVARRGANFLRAKGNGAGFFDVPVGGLPGIGSANAQALGRQLVHCLSRRRSRFMLLTKAKYSVDYQRAAADTAKRTADLLETGVAVTDERDLVVAASDTRAIGLPARLSSEVLGPDCFWGAAASERPSGRSDRRQATKW